MASFADISELSVYLGRTFTADEQARAQQALDLATGAIQDFTDQHLFRVTGDTLVLYPASWRVVLPERPATVAAVSVDGTAATADDYRVDDDAAILYFSSTSTLVTANTTGHYKLEVTYDHGYSVIPYGIKGVCLSVAQRAWQTSFNPEGFAQKTVGDVSVSHSIHKGSPGGAQLSDLEQQAIARYRRVA